MCLRENQDGEKNMAQQADQDSEATLPSEARPSGKQASPSRPGWNQNPKVIRDAQLHLCNSSRRMQAMLKADYVLQCKLNKLLLQIVMYTLMVFT